MKDRSFSYFHVAAANILNIAVPHGNKIILSDRVFRSSFGASIVVIRKLWKLCSFLPGTQPKHMLWALLFMKTYDTGPNISRQVGASEKTVRKFVWDNVIKEIAAHAAELVSGSTYAFFYAICIYLP